MKNPFKKNKTQQIEVEQPSTAVATTKECVINCDEVGMKSIAYQQILYGYMLSCGIDPRYDSVFDVNSGGGQFALWLSQYLNSDLAGFKYGGCVLYGTDEDDIVFGEKGDYIWENFDELDITDLKYDWVLLPDVLRPYGNLHEPSENEEADFVEFVAYTKAVVNKAIMLSNKGVAFNVKFNPMYVNRAFVFSAINAVIQEGLGSSQKVVIRHDYFPDSIVVYILR